MAEKEPTEVIADAAKTLSESEKAWQNNEYAKLGPDAKIDAFPAFASKLNDSIHKAGYYLTKLDETTWNSADLEAEAIMLKQGLERVRTSMRLVLRQEFEKNGEKSLSKIKSRYNDAKKENEAGKPLKLVTVLEEYANLKLAKMLTTRNLSARVLNSVLGTDIESTPETEYKDILITNVDPLVLGTTIDRLSRYRRILQKGETTSEVILGDSRVQDLLEELES